MVVFVPAPVGAGLGKDFRQRKFICSPNEYQEFFIRQAAALLVEGVGINGNGNFFLWGGFTVRESGLIHVSMKGWTAVMELAKKHGGSFAWWGSAALVRNGVVAPTVPMKLNVKSPELWGNETRLGVQYDPIGSCILKVPENCLAGEYSVRVMGGYTYSGMTPLPARAVRDFEVALCLEGL